MKFIKEHLTLILISLITLVMVVLEISLAQSYREKLETVSASLAGKVMQQNQLVQTHPFPSKENITQIEKNQQLIKETAQKLIQAYRNPDVQDGVVEPIVWKNRFVAFRERMNSLAGANRVNLPPNFAYGFEDYVDSIPADRQHTVLLGRQLSVIELILNKLMEQQVREIIAIRRSKSESVYNQVPMEGEGGPEKDGKPVPAASGVTLPIVDSKDRIYREIPFQFEFVAEASTLRELLNFLAASHDVFVVRELSVENSNPNIVTSENVAAIAAATPSGPIIIYGRELLKVKLQVNLLEFKPVPEQKGGNFREEG